MRVRPSLPLWTLLIALLATFSSSVWLQRATSKVDRNRCSALKNWTRCWRPWRSTPTLCWLKC